MMARLFAVNLFVPVVACIAVAIIAGWFRVKRKESIRDELFEDFKKAWKASEKESGSKEKKSYFKRFFDLFVQNYEYESYVEKSNKLKYYIYKLLVQVVILCIPFLVLFLITRKEWVLNDGEWNNIYLYTVILVPLVFAYLANRYIGLRRYNETWHRHLRTRRFMEWRMLVFVKDYELYKEGKKTEGAEGSADDYKIAFINEMCDYWKTAVSEIKVDADVKEDSIFNDIKGLLGKDK